MSTPLRAILALLDIKVDGKELEEADAKIDSLLDKVKEAGETLAEAFAVEKIKAFFEKTIEAAAHVQDLSDRLGISADALSTFGGVASLAGVQFDQAANLLGLLQKNAAGLGKHGEAAAKAFAALGVQTKDTAGQAKPLFTLLGDISEGLKNQPDQSKRAAYAMQIFGRQGRALLPILSKGRESLEATTKEIDELGHGLGDDYYKAAKEAEDGTIKIGYALGSLKDRITAAALPAIQWLIDHVKGAIAWFLEFTKKTYVVETALRFLGVLIAARLIPTIIAMGRAILSASAPMLPWIALAAAAYLVFDDLFTLMEGGKSVIGEAFDKAEGLGAAEEVARELNETWEAIIDTIKIAAEAFGFFGRDGSKSVDDVKDSSNGLIEVLRLVLAVMRSLVGAAKAFSGTLKAGVDAVRAEWEGRSTLIGGTGKGADYTKATQDLVAVGEGAEDSIKAVKDILNPTARRKANAENDDYIGKAESGSGSYAEEYAAQYGTLGQVGGGGGAAGNTTIVNQRNDTKVEVHEAKDAKATGAAVGAGVSTANQKNNRNALFNRNNP